MYRKAALKVVRDVGETALPESDAISSAAIESSAQTVETQVPPPAITSETVESEKASDASTSTYADQSSTEPERKTVTTQERKPMTVPDTVHLRITPENLKDYVGPPIYHKDRFYIRPPPPGVSTGLGYLGNGSGAVMPVEATVRFFYFLFGLWLPSHTLFFVRIEHAWERLTAADRKVG